MIDIIMEILLWLLMLLLMVEFIATPLVYGKYLRDKDFLEALLRHKEKGVRFNQFNNDIVNVGNLPYISTLPIRLTAKYHISGLGRVPRWSQMHTELEKIYKDKWKSILEDLS